MTVGIFNGRGSGRFQLGRDNSTTPHSIRAAEIGAKAAGSGEGHSRTKSPKAKNHASGDGRTDERPNKYFKPSAAFNHVAKKVAGNAANNSADYSREL
jgi:hypothetical protein